MYVYYLYNKNGNQTNHEVTSKCFFVYFNKFCGFNISCIYSFRFSHPLILTFLHFTVITILFTIDLTIYIHLNLYLLCVCWNFEGPSWLWSYGSWIYNYLCNQCISPLTLWVWIPLRQGVLDTTLCDKVCQWLTAGRSLLRVFRFAPPIKLTATM